MSLITVVVADHQAASRAACVRLLQPAKGIRVVREARSDAEALASLNLKPRVFLLNPDMCPGYSFSLLRALRAKSPQTKLLLLARRFHERGTLDALSHGARGYLETRVLNTFLPKAVRAVDAGEAWIPRRVVPRILTRLARLSAREEVTR